MAYQTKSYRKFVATAATAALVASAVAPAASAASVSQFKDVASKYKDAVQFLLNAGASGTSETTFGTDQNLKRGDAAVLIAKVLGLDTTNAPDAGFTDLNDRIKGAVNALASKGIISKSAKYNPNATLTRGEMAKIIANAYGLKSDASVPFKDLGPTFGPYIKALYAYDVTKGASETTFGTNANIKRGDFAIFLKKASEVKVEPVTVSAINGSQLEVKFSKEVDEASAENPANYTILRNATPEGGFTAELQEDDKTVIITLATPVANTTTANFSITIQNVLLEGSYYDTVEYYATSLLVADTKAPEIVSVTSTTNANTASSVEVTFSEPIASPTLKVDGVTKPASLSADGYTATITNLDLSVTGTHTIEAVNLTDLSGNVTATTTKSFSVTKDTNAATYTVSTSSDNAILLTFNKAMNATTVLQGVVLKGEDLNDLAAGDYTVSTVGTSNKVFKIQVNANPFTSTKTSYKYTIVTKNTIADSLGNLSPATTNSATLSVDTTKPTVQSINYVKDNTGKVTKLLVKYSEAVTAQAGTIAIKDLTDGSTDASVTTTGTVLADGQTVEYTLATATALTGEYEVSLPAGIVEDTAFGTNALLLTKQTVNFGAASATTLKVASASVVNNVATVNFDKDVTYASATNPANYTINGVALPADTVVTYVSATQVTFTLPTNFIATSDNGAVLRVANVKTASGVTVSTNQTVVSVTDNTLPVFSKTAINADGTVSLTFSEAVVSSAGSIGDFTFAVNNKDVTVGNGNVSVANGAGADAGKYVFTFSTSVATTNETNPGDEDATATIYFDVDGNGAYSSTVDVLIQSYTGLEDADLANYTPATYNASKFSSVVIGSIAAPTVVEDAIGNALKGDQAITVK